MSEIFRHLRPFEFDYKRKEIGLSKNGGISFLLKPTDIKRYEYWIYICPLEIPFSNKVAVKRLRDISNAGIVSWWEFEIDERLLIDQLCESAVLNPLGVTVRRDIESILRTNKRELAKFSSLESALAFYNQPPM